MHAKFQGENLKIERGEHFGEMGFHCGVTLNYYMLCSGSPHDALQLSSIYQNAQYHRPPTAARKMLASSQVIALQTLICRAIYKKATSPPQFLSSFDEL
jgi:hypothetical protein